MDGSLDECATAVYKHTTMASGKECKNHTTGTGVNNIKNIKKLKKKCGILQGFGCFAQIIRFGAEGQWSKLDTNKTSREQNIVLVNEVGRRNCNSQVFECLSAAKPN